VASVDTREMQNILAISNQLYTNLDVNEAYRIDAKPYVNRPFFIEAVDFSITAARYSMLNGIVKFLPGDVIRSNPSLLNAMKIGAYYRANLVLNISMAGTITHAGCVLAGIIPPWYQFPTGDQKRLINTILTGPHAFLFANEATSVNIEVPWYCNTDMATLDMEGSPYIPSLDVTPINGNYGTLILMVLNPLAPSTGSSTNVSIIVEACFKNLDILVPTPRYVKWVPESFLTGLLDMATGGLKAVAGDALDSLRGKVKQWTGLHNPNNATISDRLIITKRNFPNTVDSEQFFEKLDPESQFNRIVHQPIFGTDMDEHSLNMIVSKKQYLGTTLVSTLDPVGTLLWVRPISPFQGGIVSDIKSTTCANNLELLHTMHRAWRGSLKLHIQSVMNNKQQVKLKILKMYNPSVKSASNYPIYSSIVNAPSHLLEFTQGGQEHVVDLPYLCRNELTPCAADPNFEGLFHGLYYIYVAQPLVNSDGSPIEIGFNIYMSGGPDLTFYGYATKNTNRATWAAESMVVMNEPQKQTNIITDDKENQISFFDRLKPNLDIRPLIRRMYKAKQESFDMTSDNSVSVVPLSSLIGENPYNFFYTPIETISRMYYGKSVGFKFSALLQEVGPTPLANTPPTMRVYYVPPTFSYLTSDNTVYANTINLSNFSNYLYSNPDVAPLNFQAIPVTRNVNTSAYEFEVPNVTYFKFMGSPNQFRPFNGSVPVDVLSTADYGSLVFVIVRPLTAESTLVSLELFFGLSDESRLGFHTIAPPFSVAYPTGVYLGNSTGVEAPISGVLNPKMYKGGYF